MKTKESIPSWDEIIFEKRNKTYGAFELRTNYQARLSRAFIITVIGGLLLFLVLYHVKPVSHESVLKPVNDSVVFSDFSFHVNYSKQEDFKKAGHLPPAGKLDENSFVPVTDTVITVSKDTSGQIVASADTISGTETASLNGNPGENVGTAEKIPENIQPYNIASVEKQPEFPGGIEKFYKYLTNNIHYTDEALAAKLSKRMYIHFIIDEEGFIRDIKIMNKAGFGLDEEIQKVLLRSPKWSPGFVRKEPVKTEIILPVNFNLLQ